MAGRTLDTSRFGVAMARPGLDTRVWTSLAVALGDSTVDPTHGVFVDVKLLPSGQEVTCRVASEYAGVGVGLYVPVKKDDELIVIIPDGDPAHGPVVARRLWSASDPPPSQAGDSPDDFVLVVEEGTNIRLTVSGAGKVILTGDTVLLGSEDAAKALAVAERVIAELNALKKVFTGPGVPPAIWVPVPGDGGAALLAALTILFNTGWPGSVDSTVAKVKD